MTYMNGWSWFLYTVMFFLGVGFSYIFIHPLMALLLAIMWAYGIIRYAIMYIGGVPVEYEGDDEEYFTGDDYISCKVGEWISKR